MMHQGLASWSLLKLGPCSFSNSFSCGLVTKMVRATCGPCFFRHSWTTWPSSPQYKKKLFLCQHCFFCSMKGLNIILSIYTGSSFRKIAKGWASIVGGIFFCVVSGTKFLCVINVASWRFSYWCSKNLLSHWTTYAMAWLNVEGSSKVNSKSFTSPHNPNWNWLMNASSPHEILQANCLNSDAYTTIEHDPWQRDHILMLNMRSLSKSHYDKNHPYTPSDFTRFWVNSLV
jgi:hypothetical protein